MSTEKTVLRHLLHNEPYGRKVLPFLKSEYFRDADQVVFDVVDDYVKKYNAFPTVEAVAIDLANRPGVQDSHFEEAKEFLKISEPDLTTDLTWLVDQTEEFCKQRAVYNAVMASIKIIDDKTGKLPRSAIPKMLSDALSVSFAQSIGHDYIEDTESQHDWYHQNVNRVRLHLDYINKITRGGLQNKTMTVLMAGTNVGKSLTMCDLAAGNLMDSKNVLYITLEMSENHIRERIDANLLDIPIDMLDKIPKETYMSRASGLSKKTNGRLIIKEYPGASVHAGNFRYLLQELRIKKNFKPDIIYVDYLNEMTSSRVKVMDGNSYSYIKFIATELRGLAVEFDVPIVTATQMNRSGYANSDPTLADTAESFGLPMIADLQLAIVETPELADLNQLLFIQLKNRLGDKNKYRKFVIGIDRQKMRLYDVEQSAQKDLIDSGHPDDDPSESGAPIMDGMIVPPSGKFKEFR